jgi:membrane protein YdbS with pleckstrin-like domain
VAQQEPTALLAELKTDVAPSTWAIGALIVIGAALAIAGAASAAPFWPAIIGGALMAVVAAVIAVQIAAVRSVTFRITTQRIEIERGYLSKKYGSLDLFRVKDVVLEQGIIDRMRGVGKLTIYSTDATEPVLEIGPVADARALYERLRNAVAEARRSSGTAVLQ